MATSVDPDPVDPGQERKPRDSAYWADPVRRLQVSGVPAGAINLNVEGRQVVGPLQGFGQLWQKTYRLRLSGVDVTPAQVISAWKQNFQKFWPSGSYFYAPLTSIEPGEVAVLNLPVMPGGVPLSTGIMVIYADDESFTFMTPEGHMFAGWITFSAYEDLGTVAQTQVLIRANDPLWEVSMRLFGFRKEDEFWHHTLKALGRYFGVEGQVQQETTCVDPKVNWSQAKNIWHNAGIRSGLYVMTAPVRWVRGLFRRQRVSV